MFDHAALLAVLAHHVTGGVLQVDQRVAQLAHLLDEVGGLVGPGHVDGAVVADEAHLVPFDARLHAQRGRTVQGLELQQLRAVGQPRHDLAHVHRLAQGFGHEGQQVVGRVQRRGGHHQRCPVGEGGAQLPHHLARHAQRLPVVLGQMLAQTRHACVHLGAAQLFFGRDLASGGLEQRRPGQKSARATAHHDDNVAQARHVSATGRARTVLHGDDGQASGRQPREVAKQPATQHKTLNAVLHEVGARALHQVDEGQLVLQRNLLHTQDLLQPAGPNGASIDTRIAGHHQTAHPTDKANAGHHAATGHRFAGVLVVLQVARQRTQRQPGRAHIQQQSHALARQQLATLFKHRQRLGRGSGGAFLQGTPLADARQHGGAAGLGHGGGGIKTGDKSHRKTLGVT